MHTLSVSEIFAAKLQIIRAYFWKFYSLITNKMANDNFHDKIDQINIFKLSCWQLILPPSLKSTRKNLKNLKSSITCWDCFGFLNLKKNGTINNIAIIIVAIDVHHNTSNFCSC